MDANRLSSISQADTDEKIGEFWIPTISPISTILPPLM